MLKAAVCGVGARGLEHVDALQKTSGITLEGCFDSSERSRQQVASYTTKPCYGHLDDLLHQCQPDVVVVATPPQVRLSVLQPLIQFGSVRAILVEKPLALSLAEARQIQTLACKHQVFVTVGHQLRFSPEFVHLKAALTTGAIGQVQSLQAFCYGNLINQGIHLVDLLRWLMSEQQLAWVMAQRCDRLSQLAQFKLISRDYSSDLHHPAPTWLSATLGFTGGVSATLNSGVLNQALEPDLGDWLQKRIVVIGSEGIAEAHSASHFKLLNAYHPGWQIHKTSMTEYQNATLALHQHVVERLTKTSALANLGNQSEPSDTKLEFDTELEDAIRSLDATLGCLSSSLNGDLVALPLPETSDPIAQFSQISIKPSAPSGVAVPATIAPEQPLVSVLITLQDHRNMSLEMLSSWLEQRCDPQDFEVILILDETLLDLKQSLQQKLRPHDRLLVCLTTNEIAQYDMAAKQARGQFLFFSEPHCIAEPEVIIETIHYFKTHDLDGFCVRTIPLSPNAIARMESRMYEEGFRQFSQPDDWCKVILRGFAVRRSVYLECGGFDHTYDRFAEWLFAAVLKAKGYRFGYAPSVGVQHLYSDNFRLLDDFIQVFTEGECLFRLDSTPEFCHQFFGSPPEWYAVRGFDRSLIQLIVRQLSQQLINLQSQGIDRLTNLRQLLRFLPLATLGTKQLLLTAHLSVWLAKLRCYCWWLNKERMYPAFLDYWTNSTTLSRIRFARKQPQSQAAATSFPQRFYPLQSLDSTHLFGFYPLECHQGQVFRWSSTVAAIRVYLEPADYQVTLHLIDARQFTPEQELSIWLDRHRVESIRFDPEQQTLQFSIPQQAILQGSTVLPSTSQPAEYDVCNHHVPGQWLVLFCLPWRFNDVHLRDSRSLGIPLIAVDCEPCPLSTDTLFMDNPSSDIPVGNVPVDVAISRS